MTNSIHDMGGMHGFGPIAPEPDEPVFHADWERRVPALQLAMRYAGLWTLDGFRSSLENLPPLTYLASSYFERWCRGHERLLIAHGSRWRRRAGGGPRITARDTVEPEDDP